MPQNPDTSIVQWPTGREVWWRWTLASSIALVIGVPLGLALCWTALLMGSYVIGLEDENLMILIGAPSFGVFLGAASGIAQQIAMRRILPVAARRWTVLTIAGALVGSIAVALVVIASFGLGLSDEDGWMLAPVCGALGGAMIGLAQRFALPQYFPRRWWVLASSVSWCLGASLFTAGCVFVFSHFDMWATRQRPDDLGPVAALAILTMTVVFTPVSIGATSGAALGRLVARLSPTSCLSCGYDLTGLASNVCPECGQEWAVRSGSTGVWRPRKRTVWSGILGFVIAFIAVMFLTEGGRSFVFGLSVWAAPSAIPWVVKSLGAGVIVGGVSAVIGGVIDRKGG